MNAFEKQLQDAVNETSHFPEGTFDRGFHIGLSLTLDRYRKYKEQIAASPAEALYRACQRMLLLSESEMRDQARETQTRAALVEMEAAVKLYEDTAGDAAANRHTEALTI